MSDLVEVVRSAMPEREEEWGQVDPEFIADKVTAHLASTLGVTSVAVAESLSCASARAEFERAMHEMANVTVEDVHFAWGKSNVARGLELSPSLAEALAAQLTQLLKARGLL